MSSSTYKPSPLSFGSPRTSPFRRPESPASPSTARAITPTPSPTKHQTPIQSPTKASTPLTGTQLASPRGAALTSNDEGTASPTRTAAAPSNTQSRRQQPTRNTGDALSRLDATQVRELRDAFQMLDRDSDGLVTRDDVAAILNDLGQDSAPSMVSAFFPPGTSQNLTLPQFLTQISTPLAAMSRPDELVSAFGAFDDEDNGQIDVADLRQALLHTAPERGNSMPLTERELEKAMSGFTGRKVFSKKNLSQGEIFRYQDFVAAVTGTSGKPKDRSR